MKHQNHDEAKGSNEERAGQTGAAQIACPSEEADVPLEGEGELSPAEEAADDGEECCQPEPRRDLRDILTPSGLS